MPLAEFGSIRVWQTCRIMTDPQGLKNTIQFSSTNVIPLGWIKTGNSQGRSLLKSKEVDEVGRDVTVVQRKEDTNRGSHQINRK